MCAFLCTEVSYALQREIEYSIQFNYNRSQREFIKKQAEKLGISASEFIRDLIDVDRERRMNHELEMAAAALADEYRNNAELGQFTAIDGDPFLWKSEGEKSGGWI